MNQPLPVEAAASTNLLAAKVAVESVPGLESYGLKQHILSPIETLAQSISTIAPTASPTITIPLVFALSGNGTWLVYLFATIAVLLVALCVSRFARYSASPGSLYAYATSSLPPAFGSITAWALLAAYIGTGSSVAGGFVNYANVLLLQLTGRQFSPALIAAVAISACIFIAYRDVKVSAQLMLWIEAVSVSLITIVIVLLLWKNGLHLDLAQLKLKGVSTSGMRLGVVLALFSFVGFESATTLGAEAREPLKTIPRAVIQCAILTGIFFILSAYTEVLGFRGSAQDLGTSPAPLHVLSQAAGVKILGPMIDVGALISLFACTLACITASARVLLLMSHTGLAHRVLGKTHHRNETPGAAVIVVGLLTLVPTVALAARGVSGLDIYGWMGSLATYGFITAYALVAIALPFFLKRQGHLTPVLAALSAAATIAMILTMIGTVYPASTTAPYNWLPYFYLAYLAAGVLWFFIATRKTAAVSA